MSKVDLILLHAPSVYDFRKLSIMYGPVSDLVPSTPIFEMYPIGFSSIADYLERHGYSVRIINIAVRMLNNPKIDVEKLIESLDARLFGIDLHWLPHAHGSIEIASLVKKYHPDTPVVFGGFSSTYFHQELIAYPQVDLVLKGDSTEEPFRQLIEAVKKGGSFSSIPNLTWKDKDGSISSNDITYVPDDIDHLNLDYTYVMRSVIKYRDLMSTIPFKNWLDYPITAALTCRGCSNSCVTCGGSKRAFQRFIGRDKPAFRDPELLANDIKRIQQHIKGPVFILGDIRQAGDEYANTLLESLKKRRVSDQIALEFFTPPPRELFEKIKGCLPHYSIELSIESHDPEIRRAFGKNYSSEEVESALRSALENDCERADLYFMTGIPRQTASSVNETADYCDRLYQQLNGDKRLLVFISPMAPFLDPGSEVFEAPEKFGYRLTCRTLEEHRQALLNPSWKYILNYESDWMSRDELVDSTYLAALELNKVKARYGAVDHKTAKETELRISEARQMMKLIDETMVQMSNEAREEMLRQLKLRMEGLSISTVCEKTELEWSPSFFFKPRMAKFKLHKILPTIFLPRKALTPTSAKSPES